MSSAARPRLAAALVARDRGSGVHDLIEVTDQVETMEQLSQASRRVSATARQIAAAALPASLSVNLKATADIRSHRAGA